MNEVYRRGEVVGREEFLPCGCAAQGSHSRKRCAEGRKLRREVRRLLDLEAEARRDFGPASPERHEIMADRLAIVDEYRVHLSAKAVA